VNKSPCKLSEPYDNPFWENSYGRRYSGGYNKDSGVYNKNLKDMKRIQEDTIQTNIIKI
jgi:hypothetical protein